MLLVVEEEYGGDWCSRIILPEIFFSLQLYQTCPSKVEKRI